MNPSAYDAGTIVNNVNNQNAQTAQPQTAPHQSGNWFTHLLPTIGSVAAPILGTLLAPETGGLSLLAGAALSGAGAATGKAVQNAAEGKSALDNSDITAGLEGTIGGLGGGLLGKAFGGVGSMLGRTGENIASKTAANTAAEDAITNTANAYKDVPIGLQKAYNAKDSLTHVTNMGFDATDPNNLVHVANTSNDALNGVLDRSLANGGPVDLSHYPDLIKQQLANESGTLGSYEKIAMARGRLGNASTPAAKLLSQLEDLGAGVAKTNSDPNELRTLTTKLYNLAQDAKPSVTAATGAVDPTQRATYNVINGLRNDVKTALYDRPEVNAALKSEVGNLTPEDVGGSQALADHLNQLITQAGHGTNSGAQDLLTAISKNIDVGNLGNEGLKVGQVVTSTGAKARAAADAGLDQVPGSINPLVEAGTHVMNNAGGGPLMTAIRSTLHLSQNPAILSTLARASKVAEKGALPAGSIVATSPNLGASPVQPTGGTMGVTDNTGITNGTEMNPQANPLQQYVDAMRAQSILAPNLAGQSGAGSFMQSIAPMLQHNQLLSSEMNGLPAGYANAGGAQGTPGILSRISALIPGTAANTYHNQQTAAAHQLAQSLGISPEAAAALLPQLMQNQQSSGIQQGILGQLQGQLVH